MGLIDDVAGALDNATGSVDESVGRQFDDTQGGGFADEYGAVVDPTRSGSAQTERDIRAVARYTFVGDLAQTSDLLDAHGNVAPPKWTPDDPLSTPTGDGELFSGDSPTDVAVQEGEKAAQGAANVAGDVFGGIADAIPWKPLVVIAALLVFVNSAADDVVKEAAN